LAAVRDMPNFVRCLRPGCESGQIHDNADDEPIVICVDCHFKICFNHQVAWHVGRTCKEYDEVLAKKKEEDQEEASAKLIADNAKKCPNPSCGHGIIKNGGCDLMTCEFICPSRPCTLLTL
jgi:hypothetical protein